MAGAVGGGGDMTIGCWGGDVAEEEVAGVGASLDCCICLKKGFLEADSKDEATGSEGGTGWLSGIERGADGGDAMEGSWELVSRERIWLLVGVVSWGVISCGPSSSDELSSPSPSNCNCNCLSFSFAASSSARCAASFASLSFASFSAACLLRFSSCFLILPCLTCSSKALRRA